jgi:hypothetical protein
MTRKLIQNLSLALCLFTATSGLNQLMALPSVSDSGIQSRTDLEYGTVLFEYHQQDYFKGLIEHEFAAATGNAAVQNQHGQLLKGGMALSYGLPDTAQNIFDRLLTGDADERVHNRAWYYLAKLYHQRSKPAEAYAALEKIHGNIPMDLHLDYHYLATLVNSDGEHLNTVQQAIDQIPTTTPQYPYLVFNLGVSYLKNGDQAAALSNLQTVVNYADNSEELQVLADRARHGLAQLYMQDQNLFQAWLNLRDIRTTGLYSSRALLAYSWAAIRQEQYEVAVPALQLLNSRSIALPEVQECKVLLGHLYEQQGSMTRALKSHIDAEKEFLSGIEKVAEARRIIDLRDVPREFIENLDAIVDDTDWYGAQPSVDYQKLTPFLVDLMASNAFTQVLSELAELYAIRDNMAYWADQTDQHKVILASSAEKVFDDNMQALLRDNHELHRRLNNQQYELDLMTLTLDVDDQARFTALMENNAKELAQLSDTIKVLTKTSAPYRQPPEYPKMVADNHQRIDDVQKETEYYIAQLEPVMRNLVKVELDKHEERMRYYLAQSRLAKARLYDTALIKLENGGEF